MATDTQATAPALVPYRLTARQFERMCEADVFGDSRAELLGGVLIAMVTYPPHDFGVMRLAEALRHLLPQDGWHVREEKFVRLGRFWYPQPDVAVARGPMTAYAARKPLVAELPLVIEVSDTTYAKDRGVKWRRYAAARIPAYWIWNIPRKQLEAYADPTGRGMAAVYRDCRIYAIDAEVPVILDGHEVGRIAVKDLLPP